MNVTHCIKPDLTAELLSSVDRTLKYLNYVDKCRNSTLHGNTFSSNIPSDVGVPETDTCLIDAASILTCVQDLISTSSEEEVYKCLYVLEDAYELDFAYMLLGIPLAQIGSNNARNQILTTLGFNS